MAIYHLSVKVIGRNDGRSSVAAAAYRAAENITNEYDGVVHDFTKKNWVEHAEIILPENAPEEYRDRSILWNAVEMIEKSQDAQLAREFEVALPAELSKEQQIEVVRRFVKDNLTSQGMIADVAIHNPPVTNDRHQPIDESGNVTRDKEKMQFINPHAHILCSMRPMDENGKWERKSEIEYICKRGDEERAFTAAEFKEAKSEGWQKQYRYREGNKKVYYTAAEGEARGLERINRSPKTTPYGRKNETVEYWNNKNRIFEWRQQWERAVNHMLRDIGSDARIDSRSYEEQGRDEMPTIHMGSAATNMEKRADRQVREGKNRSEVRRSDIGDINREVREHNRLIREIKEKIERMAAKARDVVEELARKLEGLRARLIGNQYEEAVITKRFNQMKAALPAEADRLDKYRIEIKKIDDANKHAADEIERLRQRLKQCSPLQIKTRSEITKKIQKEQEGIEHRSEYRQQIARMCKISSDDDYTQAVDRYNKKVEYHKRLGGIIGTIKENDDKISEEYKKIIGSIPEETRDEVDDRRMIERTGVEKVVRGKLLSKYGEKYDEHIFEKSKRLVDKQLDPKTDTQVNEKERSKVHSR